MPFDNLYNQQIKQKIKSIAHNKVSHDKAIAENPTAVDPTSQQEFITVTNPELHGGSGNLATTSFDLGIEPKMVGGELTAKKVNKRRQKKLIDAMEGTKPITAADVAAAGVVTKPKRVRVKKVGGDLSDVVKTVGDVVSTACARCALRATACWSWQSEEATKEDRVE